MFQNGGFDTCCISSGRKDLPGRERLASEKKAQKSTINQRQINGIKLNATSIGNLKGNQGFNHGKLSKIFML